MADSPPSSRSIRLVRPPAVDGVGVFCVRAGEEVVHYAMHEIPCEIGGRGFVVHKLGLGQCYHVRVGRREHCSCECLGYLRHGHCRHILGLLALLHHGLI